MKKRSSPRMLFALLAALIIVFLWGVANITFNGPNGNGGTGFLETLRFGLIFFGRLLIEPYGHLICAAIAVILAFLVLIWGLRPRNKPTKRSKQEKTPEV